MQKKKIILIGFGMIVLITLLALMLGVLSSGNDNFTENKYDINNIDEINCIDIETPYVNITIPKEWEDEIRIEKVDDEVYIVQFYSLINNEDEVHISDLIFDGEEGHLLGYIKTKNDEKVPIRIIHYDMESSERLSEDEVIEIQNSQRIVEFAVDVLVENENFEFPN